MNAPLDAGIAPFVLSNTRDSVLTLTLNRGERFNALSSDMLAALTREIDEAADRPDVRVVVIGANGRGFCAGHDLKELRAHPDLEWQRRLFDACSALMIKLTKLPHPVIARVHGLATAAGCQLVSMCDLAVAADTARFALPGVNVGVFCGTPAVGVVRNVARKRVMQMLLTGDTIDASTAERWGLINKVVPLADLDAAVDVLADRIKARSAAVVARGKRTFYEQADRPLADAYAVASESMACNLLDPDAAEGIDAFVEKREPKFNQSTR
jgi:enoyl-CoA hydratase/carnithine racemase